MPDVIEPPCRQARCDVCPVAEGVQCRARRTGAARVYCDRIRAGDAQALAVVLDPPRPCGTRAPRQGAAPIGDCGCGGG